MPTIFGGEGQGNKIIEKEAHIKFVLFKIFIQAVYCLGSKNNFKNRFL